MFFSHTSIHRINHSFFPNAKVTLEQQPQNHDAIVVLTTKDVEAGHEIFIDYGGGVSNNDHFLIDYGFVSDFNPADDLLIQSDMKILTMAAEFALASSSKTPPIVHDNTAQINNNNSFTSNDNFHKKSNTLHAVHEANIDLDKNWREDLLMVLSSRSGSAAPFKVTRLGVDKRMMTILRILSADVEVESVLRLKLNENFNIKSSPTDQLLQMFEAGNVNERNELLARTAFYFVLTMAQSSLPTTLEQDEQLHAFLVQSSKAQGSNFEIESTCVNYRMQKKQLLKYWMEKTKPVDISC
jgi:hypothetical protein